MIKGPILLLVLFTVATAFLAGGQSRSAAVETKIAHLEQNGALPQPDQTPTVFSQQEINDYVASGVVKLPKGVQSVRFASDPGVITSNARVDFDELKSGRGNANPLLSVFSGVHGVVVVAHARGSGHTG